MKELSPGLNKLCDLKKQIRQYVVMDGYIAGFVIFLIAGPVIFLVVKFCKHVGAQCDDIETGGARNGNMIIMGAFGDGGGGGGEGGGGGGDNGDCGDDGGGGDNGDCGDSGGGWWRMWWGMWRLK